VRREVHSLADWIEGKLNRIMQQRQAKGAQTNVVA
jgi:hypothetical protein